MRTTGNTSDIKPKMSSADKGVKFSPSPTYDSKESISLSHFIISDSPRSPQQRYEAYVVTAGRRVGIFMSWLDAKEATQGIPEARYKGYSLNVALQKWNEEMKYNTGLYHVAMSQFGLNNRSPKATVQPPSTPQRRQRSFSPPSTPSLSQLPPFAPTPSHQPSTTFYVVQCGERPGVYIGRTASWNAAGPDPRAHYFSTSSKEAAWETFGKLVMAGEIEYL